MAWSFPPIWFIISFCVTAGFMLGILVYAATRRRRISREHTRLTPVSSFREVLKASLIVLVLAGLFLGFSSPRLISQKKDSLEVSNLKALFLVDVSHSMAARKEPFLSSRLDRAKKIVRDTLPQLRSSEVALSTFSSTAPSRVPFTRNHAYVRESLDAIAIDSAPVPGSDLEHAAWVALSYFKKNEYGLIILLTDGETRIQGTSYFYEALEELRSSRVRVIAVGVGEKEGEKIPIFENGEFTGIYEKILGDGVYVSFPNEELPRLFADESEGKYVAESNVSAFTPLLAKYVDEAGTHPHVETTLTETNVAKWFFILAWLGFLGLWSVFYK